MSQVDTENRPGAQGAVADVGVGREGETIDVAFGVDGKFAPHAAAVIASIVRHAPQRAFRFIILHDGVSELRRKAVESAAPTARFCWIAISDGDVPGFTAREHYTRAILFRLGLEKLAPADCRRVIYLDADIIVLRDLYDLWSIDLEGAPIGAVVDTFSKAEDFAPRWGLPLGSNHYFNSGVLLIDLERVRAEGLFSAAIGFVAKHDDDVRFSDQDALNWAAWGRWKQLGNEWNTQRDMVVPYIAMGLPDYAQLKSRQPAIVHFTGKEKPWLPNEYHPWPWIYWRSLARTPFQDEISKRHGMTRLKRARLWLRWLRRRPRAPS